jgi:DNA mismatch repair protein MutS
VEGITQEDSKKQLKLTPMMRQYLSVKEAHPEAIVFFRMGDFFETFFEDAKRSAQILDITLTARSKEQDIPMAGVPHHALDAYLGRLIDAGQRVVIVDQVQDPKDAKGLVQREVTRVLSPGTYIDPRASGRRSNYLAAVAVDSSSKKKSELSWGLAVMELGTGEFTATSGIGEESLIDELMRLQVRELVVDETGHGWVSSSEIRPADLSLTQANADWFRAPEAVSVLTQVFGAEEAGALRQSLDGPVLRAAGVVVRYVRETEMRTEAQTLNRGASLAHLSRLRTYVPGDGLVLDTQARAHLELFRTQSGEVREGTLLASLDETVTPMGGRRLVRWMTYPERQLAQIEARLDAVTWLVQRPSVLDRIRASLKRMGDVERLLGRVTMRRATPRDLRALLTTLEAVPSTLGLLPSPGGDREPASSTAGGVLNHLSEVDPCVAVAKELSDALADDPPTDPAALGVFRQGYDPGLDEQTRLSRDGKSLIAELEAEERARTKISSLKIRYNRVFGYYIEITKANLHLVPDEYIRKQTTVNGERYFTEALKALETRVLAAEDTRSARALVLFDALLVRVSERARLLKALAEALATLDVFCSLAQVAAQRGWVRPVVDESFDLDIEAGRHPVLELMCQASGERFVPNDILLSEESQLTIVTGPNMAGKSTVMRQTALIVLLAQMGSFVPASRARIGLVDRIFTRVGASDDLSRGRSTFMVEMSETARILRSATERSLVILDEIGRGTSTYDGLSIAWAVAEFIHDHIRAKTLFATHYHELTELARDRPRAVNRHVVVREHNQQVLFLRTLAPGPTSRSYGIEVARMAGLPKEVISRAREILGSLESTRHVLGNESPAGAGGRVEKVGSNPQLSLFQGMNAMSKEETSVLEALRALVPDEMTPIQALQCLVRLRQALLDRECLGDESSDSLEHLAFERSLGRKLAAGESGLP